MMYCNTTYSRVTGMCVLLCWNHEAAKAERGMREVSPVIMYDDMREAVCRGAVIEVECIKEAQKVSNQYSGEWKFYVNTHDDPELGTNRFLYIQYRSVKPRLVKTVTGLMSLAIELGVEPFSVPYHEGETAEWKRRGASETTSPKDT